MINDDEAARRTAAESLDILFDVLGYRGAQPLALEVVGERLARKTLAHERLRPNDLALILRQAGYPTEVVKEGDDVSLVLAGERIFMIVPSSRGDDYGAYRRYEARACFGGPEGLAVDAARNWAAASDHVRAHVGDDGEVLLTLKIDLAGGLTENRLVQLVCEFDCEVRGFEGVIEGLDRGSELVLVSELTRKLSVEGYDGWVREMGGKPCPKWAQWVYELDADHMVRFRARLEELLPDAPDVVDHLCREPNVRASWVKELTPETRAELEGEREDTDSDPDEVFVTFVPRRTT